MTTDRELLELAAKAAGMTYSPTKSELGLFFVDECVASSLWNPLTDDGDALRLAVKLSLDINHGLKIVQVSIPGAYVTELCEGGRISATRRAIVRAAAAIGSKS